jgi:hypothetical protein
MNAMQKEVAEVVTKYLKVNNNKPSTVVGMFVNIYFYLTNIIELYIYSSV